MATKKTKTYNFGKALEALKDGKTIRRQGWNGVGIFIALQTPDKKSKMSQPYL